MISQALSSTGVNPTDATRPTAHPLEGAAFLEELSLLAHAVNAPVDAITCGAPESVWAVPTGNPPPHGGQTGNSLPVVPDGAARHRLLSTVLTGFSAEYSLAPKYRTTVEPDAATNPLPTEPTTAPPVGLLPIPAPSQIPVAEIQSPLPAEPQRLLHRQDHVPAARVERTVVEPTATARVAVQVTAACGEPSSPLQQTVDIVGQGAPLMPGTNPPALSATVPAMAEAHRVSSDAVTRVVEQLAMAREAMAPLAMALTLDHAELGDLALRFNQSRHGALNVSITASDPQAQQAIAAAVGQQPAVAATVESRGTAGQGHHSSPREHNQAPGEQGHGQARDHHTARDHPHRHARPAHSQSLAGTPQHGGIFA